MPFPLLFAGLAAAAAGAGASAYGASKKAGSVPTPGTVDPLATQQQAIAGNLGVVPEATKLGLEVTSYNIDQIQKAQERLMPWLSGLESKAVAQISRMVAGQLPETDFSRLWNKGAAKAYGSGTAGAPAGANVTFRDIGRAETDTVLAGIQGIGSYVNWVANAANIGRGVSFDVTKMFNLPSDLQRSAEQERNIRYQSDMAKWSQPSGWQIAGSAIGGIGGAMIGYGAGGGFGGTAPRTLGPNDYDSVWSKYATKAQGGPYAGAYGSEARASDWSNPQLRGDYRSAYGVNPPGY